LASTRLNSSGMMDTKVESTPGNICDGCAIVKAVWQSEDYRNQ
jgi:hypothetical protein